MFLYFLDQKLRIKGTIALQNIYPLQKKNVRELRQGNCPEFKAIISRLQSES